jgi:hypothetical protein
LEALTLFVEAKVAGAALALESRDVIPSDETRGSLALVIYVGDLDLLITRNTDEGGAGTHVGEDNWS